LEQGLGAQTFVRMPGPDGKTMHSEVRIGDSVVMIGRANDAYKAVPTSLYIYLPDCDAAFQRAVSAGGKSARELQDQFYGDRSGTIESPGGIMYSVATHVEDVGPEEMKKRMAAMAA
jgi:PhnB protein